MVCEHFGKKFYVDGGNHNSVTCRCPVPAWFVKIVPVKAVKDPKEPKEPAAKKEPQEPESKKAKTNLPATPEAAAKARAAKAAKQPPEIQALTILQGLEKEIEWEFKYSSFLKEETIKVKVKCPYLAPRPGVSLGLADDQNTVVELTATPPPGMVMQVDRIVKGKGKGKGTNMNGKTKEDIVALSKNPKWAHCQHLFK